MDTITQEIFIADEKESINFYAQEIGFFNSLLERVESEPLAQWCNFFIVYSTQELENANSRLKKLREELIAYQQRQEELSGL